LGRAADSGRRIVLPLESRWPETRPDTVSNQGAAMWRSRNWILTLAFVALASASFAQGNPTGTIAGRVADPDNLALPGVTVTVASPVLQGTRTAVSSQNGDYIIPFLPAGDYTVTFELLGFGTVKQAIQLKMADTLPVNVKMGLAGVTETVTVEGTATETATTATVATTMKASTVENIPLARTLEAATLMAPSANNNGPEGGITVSGGLSYDTLNLVNGVNVNDTQRQQARVLYVEDAIQETKVSSGNISAEYGRFQGGVVNMITKSGGNAFSGSFRTTFTNDGWKSLTPFPGDANIDQLVPAYELTFGGPVFKDRLWFFSAARFQKNETNQTMAYTAVNYTKTVDDKRAEGKLTYAINKSNTVKVSYLWKKTDYKNDNYETVMDLASLFDNWVDESLLAANYQTVLTNNLFIEGQYSTRKKDTQNYGAQSMDLIHGTPIWARALSNARFSAPTYCAVCPDYVNLLNNWDVYGKLNYYLSTKRLGTHNIVAGFDVFKDMRKNNQNSTASQYRIRATGAQIVGQSAYPIFRTGTSTLIDWRPVFQPTKGNDLRTYSGFFNDVWRASKQLTLSLGVRFDKNQTKNQGDQLVGNASTWSPRLGITYDVRGDGNWLANGSYAHYVAAFMTQVADAASPAGREAGFSWNYQGPSINDTTTGPYLNSYDALQQLFNWFNANGGTNRRPYAAAPTIPGVSTAVDPGIQSESTDEITVGLMRQLGNKGSVRVDFIFRQFGNVYGNFTDMSTGTVTDPSSGQTYNLTIVDNTETVDRKYKGMSVQASYRPFRDLQLSGNWMWSSLRGNIEADNFNSIVSLADADTYPEYRQADWNYPVGYLNADQRHKVRFWGSYNVPVSPKVGSLNLGFMQRWDSGMGYDYNMTVDSRPYVTNPGYITPPSSLTYYVSGRGEHRFNDIWRTDISATWTHKVVGRSEVFFRFVMNNAFNNMRMDSFNTTILGPRDGVGMAAFNPFTTKPVEDVNWTTGPAFGQASSPGSYQSPREYNVSVGIRF
jgi:outer membrane receptor for ferrienterochelin and colicin